MSPQQRILHITFVACMSFALLWPQHYAYAQSVMSPLVRSALTGFAQTSGGSYVRISTATATAEAGSRVARAAMNGGARSIVVSDTRALAVTGGRATVQTSAAVSLAEAAIAIASCLGKVLICAAVAAATAAFDAYRARRNSDGTGVEADPGIDAIREPPGTEVAVGSSFFGGAGPYMPTEDLACTVFPAHGVWSSGRFARSAGGTPSCSSFVNGDPAQGVQALAFVYRAAAGSVHCPNPADATGYDGKCPTRSYVPMTDEEASRLVLSAPPAWGSGEGGQFDGGGASGIWKDALKDAIEQGATAPAQMQSSGPASVTGTPVVTSTTQTPAPTIANPNPQPETTTTTTTPGSTLAYPPGGGVTVTDATVISTQHPDGTTTTTGPVPATNPNTPPEPAPTDTALGPVPNLYTRKYPDGITGVWRDKSAAIRATPLFSAAAGMFPNVGSNGTCPAWMLTVPGIGFSFGTFDVAPPCWIWDMAKWVVLISALLLCRALIFGG